ncbi:hypothetical protein E2C01_074054 [Portunus trituberculatus]|uniref:Uncharacterized protein n=1 Tax=Portunus trituberculatus TaxID=210409 RepID=A0A5B7IBE1_PORTR|nr:hypothetical protein [Portunus trituberculatus]
MSLSIPRTRIAGYRGGHKSGRVDNAGPPMGVTGDWREKSNGDGSTEKRKREQSETSQARRNIRKIKNIR